MYIQITIAVTDIAVREVLIARLAELGVEGFEEKPRELLAFAEEEELIEDGLRDCLQGYGLPYSVEKLAEKNWNDEWEKNFQPVIIGDFCAIRASFHDAIPGVEHELVITPKMSFGTGHHATTHLMIEAMEQQEVKGKKVLDFGTGTGILAILAEKMGASQIVAIDHDNWSIENATENARENGAERIWIGKAERISLTGHAGPFDLILANINKSVIISQLQEIGQYLQEEGVLLLSGLLEDDFEEVRLEAARNKILISGRMTKGSWICLIAKREGK